MQQSPPYVEHIEQAQERLESLLSEFQAEDRFAPVTVVVPTTYAGLYLRRDIGKRGLVNVRFMALARLAELLGASSLAANGQRPLKPPIEFAAVRRAASEAAGELESFRAHPSFHASLRSTFRDLRRAAPDALAALERRRGMSGEIARLYARYRDHTKAYYDREALAEAAADSVRTGRADTALTALGPVIAYLPRTLTPSEQRLFDALRDAWKCATILAATGDEEADEILLPAAAPSASSKPPPRPAHLLVTSDTGEEVRSVVRSIAAAHAGTPFHRMAILYWHQEPYAALIAEQLAAAGIPIAGPSTERLAATPVGRMLKGIVDLVGSDLPREEVMRWLTSCPVKPPSAGFSPSRWDAISREAGVVVGIDQWRDRLANYAAAQQRATTRKDEELSEGREKELAQSAAEAWALRSFMTRLLDTLNRSKDSQTWAAFVKWSEELIDQYLDEESLPSVERENLDTLATALQELANLDEMEDSADLATFRAALDEVLSRPAARAGALGEGLFVGPVRIAAGLRFDRVYLVGMVEGLVPAQPPDDPLLPQSEREQAGLPPRSTAAERYDYLAAAAAGRTRVLTFARGNNIAMREQHPSRWFLEQASRLYGSPVYPSMLSGSHDLVSLREQPWFEEVVSAQHGINTVSASQPADIHDYDLHQLSHWRQVGNAIDAHHLAKSEPVLTRALQMQRARNAKPVTRWDGDLSSAISPSGRIGLSNREFFSPTRLQTWATCPFRYFLSNVLGIAAPEQPEEVATISALERGSLLHTILERFIKSAQEQGTIPPPDQSWTDDHGRNLFKIADQAFQEAEQRGVTGKPLLWELVRDEMVGDLERFLKEDAKLRNKQGVSPHAVESVFGFPGDEDSATLDSVEWSSARTGTLRFRGFIDRIDLSPSGDTALVLDYKSGKTNAYANMDKDPVQRGKRLQLPVYGLAARQLLGDAVDIKVAYWFVTENGKFATRPPRKPGTLDDMLDAFAPVVGTITEGIGVGLFPANPGKDGNNCRYCEFKNLCPTRRELHWRRKRNDPRLSAYVAMADEEASR